MRKLKYILPLCMSLLACKKEVSTKDFIKDVIVNPTEIAADGTSMVTITALLNDELDKRNIIFETDKGSFADSGKGNTVTITAEKINDTLKAIAKLKAPSMPGTITITVQPAITDLKGKYVFTKTLDALNSEPTKIDLVASAFSVPNDFGGEVTLTATLTNEKDNGVSQGKQVTMHDYDANFNPINGVFRNESLTTKTDSKVTAVYTPGGIEANQYINIIAGVVNGSGGTGNIADTIKLFVTKND